MSGNALVGCAALWFFEGAAAPSASAAGVPAGWLSGQQSALDPAGWEAQRIAELFWWMVVGGAIVWIAVAGLALYATRRRPSAISERQARLFIIGGGVLVPTLILAGLLTYGLALLPDLLAPAPEGSLRINVRGEQWWWRVRYPLPEGGHVELANEIRLPVGEPVEFQLEAQDVIHSFWIPALGGKMDMIPGRKTRLLLRPTRTGIFRGVCAEYCGTAHALMAFYVNVMERPDFERWLDNQREPAAEPRTPAAKAGRERFFANGCAACHRVDGTGADGVVGPDLTHVGSRLSLGAGIIRNEPDDFVRWIERTDHVKPGVNMPHFGMLPREELAALAAYLDSLQ